MLGGCNDSIIKITHFKNTPPLFLTSTSYLGHMHAILSHPHIAPTGPPTWVHFSVRAHSIRVHDVLEARGELVGLDEGGRRVVARDTVDKGRQCCAAFPLQ